MFEKLKSLEILEKPETTFKRQLYKNPYYPFEKIDEKRFEIKLIDRRFYYGLITTVVLSVFTVFNIFVAGLGQYLLLCVFLIVVCAIVTWENRARRTCVLNSETNKYMCFDNGNCTYVGAFNNIYIRLKEQKYGSGKVYYYVILNGYHLHEQKITSYTTNRKRLRSLARKLATGLNLNYFDSKTISKDHLVRHQRPQTDIEREKATISQVCNVTSSYV